nr:hypothetical protein [Nitrosomonas nitrosa]
MRLIAIGQKQITPPIGAQQLNQTAVMWNIPITFLFPDEFLPTHPALISPTAWLTHRV